MNAAPPALTNRSRTALVIIGCVVAFIVVAVGLSALVYSVATAEVRAEVNTLKSEPLVTDPIPGLKETDLRFSEGGETMGKPVYTKAFRYFTVYDDLPVDTVSQYIRDKAEGTGWVFEREAGYPNDAFSMNKPYIYKGQEKTIDLFVDLSDPEEAIMIFTIR